MKRLRLGLAVTGLIVFGSIVGPMLLPYDPAAQQLPQRLAAPSAAHPFGLDELGRDILVRTLAGGRVSLLVGVLVSACSAAVGLVIGAVAGLFGGWVDEAISRVIDVLLAFPGILLAIALVAVLGPGLANVVLALSVIGWVGYARLARGQVLRGRELEFVHAARALGAGTGRILVRHLVPLTLPALLVQTTFGIAGAIVSEAALSFLGLGVQPPTPSWGTMLNGGRGHLLDAPHLTVFPGLAIALLVAGCNLIGDGLRDRFSPRGTSDA